MTTPKEKLLQEFKAKLDAIVQRQGTSLDSANWNDLWLAALEVESLRNRIFKDNNSNIAKQVAADIRSYQLVGNISHPDYSRRDPGRPITANQNLLEVCMFRAHRLKAEIQAEFYKNEQLQQTPLTRGAFADFLEAMQSEAEEDLRLEVIQLRSQRAEPSAIYASELDIILLDVLLDEFAPKAGQENLPMNADSVIDFINSKRILRPWSLLEGYIYTRDDILSTFFPKMQQQQGAALLPITDATFMLQYSMPTIVANSLQRRGSKIEPLPVLRTEMLSPTLSLAVDKAYQTAKFCPTNVIEPRHALPSLLENAQVRSLLIKAIPNISIDQMADDINAAIKARDARTGKKGNRLVASSALKQAIKDAETSVSSLRLSASLTNLALFAAVFDQPDVRNLFRHDLAIDDKHLMELRINMPAILLAAQRDILKSNDNKGNDNKGSTQPVVNNGSKKMSEEFKISDADFDKAVKDFTTDLTARARRNELDPVVGRDAELKEVMTAFLQRKRGNPMILGEAGVGKTVMFDAIASAIAKGEVHDNLKNAKLLVVDVQAMIAGTQYRGQFEERARQLFNGVAERNRAFPEQPIILCLDEVHTVMGMGASSGGSNDLSNILKPLLTDGSLKIVAATTEAEFNKYVRKDPAFERRFQPVAILAPAIKDTVAILERLAPVSAKHANITVDNKLLPALVKLADKFIHNLNQPDKSVNILERACAIAAMEGKKELDYSTIVTAVARQAKIPESFLQQDEAAKFLALETEMPKQVMGQDKALEQITDALLVSRAGLREKNKTQAAFMLVGPTGVGKTETARALARLLFGTDEALIRIDMSDYADAHSFSRMVGAPPGYVGYDDQEGQLTGQVRRRPYSVVVFDEIEKAHPETTRKLLQMLEEGEMVDNHGRKISMRNTIVLFTSNVKLPEKRGTIGFGKMLETSTDDSSDMQKSLAAAGLFPPEFLNRLDGVIEYHSLKRDAIKKIAMVAIRKLGDNVREEWNYELVVPDAVAQELGEKGYSEEFGARALKRTVEQALTKNLAKALISRAERGETGDQLVIESVTPFKANFVIAPKAAKPAEKPVEPPAAGGESTNENSNDATSAIVIDKPANDDNNLVAQRPTPKRAVGDDGAEPA